MRAFGFLLTISLMWSSYVYADATDKFIKIYNSSKDFNELVEKAKPVVPVVQYKFLKTLADGDLNQKPIGKVERGTGNEIVFTIEKLVVTVESKINSVDERVLLVNRRSVTISEFKTPEEQFNAIMKALPSVSSHWLIDQLIPKAHAQLGLLKTGAKWAIGIVSGGAMVYDATTANSFNCDYVGEAVNACADPLEKLTAHADAYSKSIKKAEKKKAGHPACPPVKDKEEWDALKTSASDAIKNLEDRLNTLYSQLTVNCEEKKKEGEKCLAKMKEFAQFVCLPIRKNVKGLLKEADKVRINQGAE